MSKEEQHLNTQNASDQTAGALTETERMVASLWSHRIIVFGIGQGYELDIDEHDVHIRVYRGIA